MKKDITELFAFVDDFYNAAKEYLNKALISDGAKQKKQTRVTEMTESEVITIVLLYHQSPCKNFKYYYKSYVQLYNSEFPKLVSYEKFVQLKPRILQYLAMLMDWLIQPSQVSWCKFY
jgi:hypothetical protein